MLPLDLLRRRHAHALHRWRLRHLLLRGRARARQMLDVRWLARLVEGPRQPRLDIQRRAFFVVLGDRPGLGGGAREHTYAEGRLDRARLRVRGEGELGLDRARLHVRRQQPRVRGSRQPFTGEGDTGHRERRLRGRRSVDLDARSVSCVVASRSAVRVPHPNGTEGALPRENRRAPDILVTRAPTSRARLAHDQAALVAHPPRCAAFGARRRKHEDHASLRCAHGSARRVLHGAA